MYILRSVFVTSGSFLLFLLQGKYNIVLCVQDVMLFCSTMPASTVHS